MNRINSFVPILSCIFKLGSSVRSLLVQHFSVCTVCLKRNLIRSTMENDEIVISGISGRFPKCDNVEKFKEALYSGVDLIDVSDERHPPGLWGIPPRSGKIPSLDKFDASFFQVLPKQADFMDTQHRMLLETVHECLIDAGFNPKELRGSKTGVYVACAIASGVDDFRHGSNDGYSNIGFCAAMAANRPSYCFDFIGPSFVVDTACSSSLVAFTNAVRDLMRGEIDSAVVCGAQVNTDPFQSLEFHRLNMLSPSGKCKVFNTNRDGYARSEAVVSYFLQKKKNCRRVYATVLGAKTNSDGYKEDGITVPSKEVQLKLLREFYKEFKVDPNEITYVEAHGTGTPLGDIEECTALRDMFCQNRSDPLLVGAVKSNMGHSEISSGMCSLTKVLLSMETGVIPANLHLDSLDISIPGIKEGKLKIVDKNISWNGGLVGVASFGFGGSNVHLALKPNQREKWLTDSRDDDECLALVDEIHTQNIEGYNYRGYAVLGDDTVKEIGKYTKERPIWFIYTGMGSQWTKMGKDLMRIEVFRNTMQKMAAVLQPYGVDLIDVITNPSPTTFDDITNCFCGIGAIEIALTDVLYSLGIIPDGIAGHSLGEVGCAYADGQITAEQAILLAYSRGYGSSNTKIPPGQMAAIGLSKERLLEILPEDIFIACYNSKDSHTISGPAEVTRAFVDKLSAQGIFAKLVKSAGIAYHTKYIMDAGNLLLEFCKGILTDPKPRSSKWVSSSVPSSKADQEWTKYNCAEYHYNNFCNPVLFDQVYEHIPKNAIVIEVAPHGLLQAILKRELGPETTSISIANRSCEDNEHFFLSAIGKIFIAGGQPNLRKLYTDVSFPVGRGTKMLSPLVNWDHSISWRTPHWKNNDAFGKRIDVDVSSDKYSFLSGHQVDGRVLMPATGYLALVWMVMADMHLQKMENYPVVMENIKFERATILPFGENVTFLVNIMKQSGILKYSKVALSSFLEKYGHLKIFHPNSNSIRSDRVERQFHQFFGCDDAFDHLKQSCRDLNLPTFMRRLIIDPVQHLSMVNKQKEIPIVNRQDLNIIKSGGIEIVGVESSRAPRRQMVQAEPHLETCDFIYYENCKENEFNFESSLRIALEIVIQNTTGWFKELNVCELASDDSNEQLRENIKRILKGTALTLCNFSTTEPNALDKKFDVIVVTKNSNTNLERLAEHLTSNGFILYKGEFTEAENSTIQVVFQATASDDSVFLLRPKCEFPSNYAVVNVRNTDFDWLDRLKDLAKSQENKVVYLFSQGEETSGIIGLIKCLLAEPSTVKYRAIFVDQETDTFSTDDEFYRDQLKKDLAFNILKKNSWGTIVNLPLADIEEKEVENASIYVSTVGDLSTIQWMERPVSPIKIYDDSAIVDVFYSALNFKDIMVATGKLHLNSPNAPATAPEINIGLEFSGITTTGKRVMGTTEYEGLSLRLYADAVFLWEIPDSWSLRDAATVPCVYSTCYYAMIIRGQMQPGESILIHAGTGGIGMAAISIALSMNCRVFTTVGSKEKKEYIRKMFPKLEDKNIGNSRNSSFEELVMENTGGKGVDLLLNSLSAELFQASLRCIARRGRFLEIGKVDFSNRTPIDSKMFLKNCSFHGILLDDLFESNSQVKRDIQRLVNEGIAHGVVKPLPSTVFSETEVEDAFRFLSSGKHRGKVLVEVRKETSTNLKSPSRRIMAAPRVYFDPNKTYVLIGGLGGFGLELTDWLIGKGATKIILNSRRRVTNGYQSFCLKKWSQYEGILVVVSTDDTTQLEGATKLITEAEKLGPVGGVFNMALVLRDALITNQTRSNFKDVFKVKIISGQNLDTATRKYCKELDHFVVFSTITSGRGNIGQTNYGMANSALERLCEKRKRDKLPGLAVQWGPVADVGVLMNVEVQDKIYEYIIPQNITSCLNVLEKFMTQSKPVGSSVVLVDRSATSTLRVTKTPAEAVAHILGIKNIELVDKSLTLTKMGLDSLMMAEIKQTLYRNHQIELSPDEIKELTLQNLIDLEKKENIGGPNEVAPESSEKLNVLVVKEIVVKLKNSKDYNRNVFLLHPIEGNVHILKQLANNIKANVYGIQCTEESAKDTIESSASVYITHVQRIQPKGPYSLCGYSFGGALVHGMGLQLEKKGETVDMVSIDGSPQLIRHTLEPAFRRAGGSYEGGLLAVLEAFCAYFHDINQEQIRKILTNSQSYENKLKAISEMIASGTGIDSKTIAVSAECYFKRCRSGFYYKPENMFKGKVLLIRREENPYFMSEDYELQKICQQTVSVVKLKGDHKTIVLGGNGTKVSDIVNNFFNFVN
ncbi:hypothetical protein JTB14_024951 [Gonioctena quinquepunctata]|nr:hypothetical protein JTB14_024951 [Gonioctena quinquepunctata]